MRGLGVKCAGRWRGIVVVAVALAGLGGCNESEGSGEASPSSSSADGSAAGVALHGGQALGVGYEVWVLGGIAGPEETFTPPSVVLPEGWAANRQVAVYELDGDEVRRYELPEEPAALFSGTVLDLDDSQYLLGSLCGSGLGCADLAAPVLYRFTGDEIESVPLDLPAASLRGVGAGLLRSLGVVGTIAWALQTVEATTDPYADLARTHRLLGIDLTTGVGRQVDLPSGILGGPLVCVTDAGLRAIRADLDENLRPLAATLLQNRSFSTGGWSDLSVLPVPRTATSGTLTCQPGSEEVLLAIGNSPVELHSLRMGDGSPLAGSTTIAGCTTAQLILGTAGALVSGFDAGGQPVAVAHGPGESWEEYPDGVIGPQAHLVVTTAGVFDAQGLLTQTGNGSLTSLPTP